MRVARHWSFSREDALDAYHRLRRTLDDELGIRPSTEVETLLGAGVRVYEYEPSTLHAKTFVVDGVWTSIGTMNFDNRSLALNDESTLMILDSLAGQRMDSVFFDDLRYAKEFDLETFRRRPWYHRIGEWAADQMTRLL